MQYYALVEDWPGESMIFFRELPGCFAAAPTYEEAVRGAPAAIADYFKWLRANDLPIIENPGDEIEVVVKERLSAPGGQVGPRFEADLAPPDDTEIDNVLNVAAAARAALLDLYEGVPQQDLARIPAPGAWSLAQHLQHLLEAEQWYVSRLSEHPTESPDVPSPADLPMRFFENAMDHELLLRELTPEQRAGVFVHNGEEWTAAKVLRRMAQHLREHYPWMVAIAKELGAG